jgi:phosphatidylinositol alpha-1,6-mannosyltransferase
VLSAGRLVRRKGVDTLLRAFAALWRGEAGPALVVAGDGPDRGRLEALARGLRVPVRFLGRVPDGELSGLYSAADLFVLAAREEPEGDVEGFGLVLLEAAACGTPAVACRSGGVPDAVDDGVSGLLVPPDDPAALAAALTRVLTDDALRRWLACGARARAERSGWDVAADAIQRRLEGDEAAGAWGRAA